MDELDSLLESTFDVCGNFLVIRYLNCHMKVIAARVIRMRCSSSETATYLPPHSVCLASLSITPSFIHFALCY